MISLINRIKKFTKLDIRLKLKKISKLLKIPFYPKKIYKTGIRSIYTKILFHLIFSEKSKTVKKYFYKRIFFQGKKLKHNLLVSSQRSGGNFTRMMLTSYIELFYNVGNGIPKYDSLNDKWIYSVKPILNADLYNLINFENLILNSNPFESDNEFEKKKIIFTRHPIMPLENCNLEETKPVIIMRNPYDQMISFYTNHTNEISDQNFNIQLFDRTHKNYLKYFNFWKKYFYNKISKKDYILIKHEELVSYSEEKLKEILIFYDYEIDDHLIKKSAQINSKENTLKYIENVKIKKIRFTDPKKKEIHKNKILEKLSELYKNNELIDEYNNLK